jgi:biopolymer transport protein ExbB/TolQ
MPGFSAASTLAANLDIPRLFDQAHWIVKAVMVLLAVMFVVGLYIIIYKWLYVRRATTESSRFTDSFWRSRDIEQIYKQAQSLRNSPISQMFVAGYTELAKLASVALAVAAQVLVRGDLGELGVARDEHLRDRAIS